MIKKQDELCDDAMAVILTRKLEALGTLTIESIAETLDVSPSYLARSFRNRREFSLREYLMREKMIRAVLLLSGERRLTIKELSARIGFLSVEYFSQTFKKYLGVSPNLYRKCKRKR